MSDFELLSLIMMILNIIVMILIAYINQTKKYPPTVCKTKRLLFVIVYFVTNRLSVAPFSFKFILSFRLIYVKC